MMADLMRWNPVDELQKFTDTFDRLLNRWRSSSAPTYGSISGVDDGYRVRIPLPSIAPENVTVDVAGRGIHVRATERDGDTEVMRYEEVLTLPASVDPRGSAVERTNQGSGSCRRQPCQQPIGTRDFTRMSRRPNIWRSRVEDANRAQIRPANSRLAGAGLSVRQRQRIPRFT